MLLQTGRGGGMAGLGGGASDSAFGAHTANILQKFTGVCVFLFFVMVIVLSKMLDPSSGEGSSRMDNFKGEKKAPAKTAPETVNDKDTKKIGDLLEKQNKANPTPAPAPATPGITPPASPEGILAPPTAPKAPTVPNPEPKVPTPTPGQ